MYAYYCLHRFRWRPRKFIEMPDREKALVMAMIDECIRREKIEAERLKKNRNRR